MPDADGRLNEALRHCLLARHGVLHVTGPDARAFLQGQLSNDVAQLDAGRPLLAGLHSPQGRVLALLRLWPDGADGALAALPSELLGAVIAQLRRYVLRARLEIVDASASWQLHGTSDALGQLDYQLHPTMAVREVTLDQADWDALEVAAGVPEIHTATAGEFVAQMLNLDCMGGISWTKGCYTGQEIIARSHYRGQVKRRMRRYAAAATEPPPPGGSWTTRDGLSMRVVRSAGLAAGRCELLGVAPLAAQSMDELPLPYTLPA